MQKLSTFEVGEVGWAGGAARNATKSVTEMLWKVVTHAHAGAVTHACVSKVLVRDGGNGNTAETLSKAGNFKQA